MVSVFEQFFSARAQVLLITTHVQRERGKVIGVGVHIYIYICLWTFFILLNHTLAIDSPFQTFTVGLLIKFID